MRVKRYIKSLGNKLSINYREFFYDKQYLKSMENIKIDSKNKMNEFDKLPYKFAVICDELYYNSVKDIVDVLYVTPKNYQDVLDAQVDVLMIVSSWRGLNNEWRGMVYDKTNYLEIVQNIISYYKKNAKNGKIVFYSKEDPVNYNHFKEYALLTDYVFTTSEEKVEDYKKLCNHNQVYVMQFGFNPVIFFPRMIDKIPSNKEVLFAGSWMPKYPERCRDLKIIFDGLLNAGTRLRIIDRNYKIAQMKLLFPFRYTRYCTPSVPHEELIKLYARYETIININSIKDSQTMFAQRVYEAMAMGCIILSNESIGMQAELPEIIVVKSNDDVKNFMSLSNVEKDAIRKRGIKRVFENHTMFHRFAELLYRIGLKEDSEYK